MFHWVKKGNEISCFVWEDWLNAAMGFVAGYNDWSSGKMKQERKTKRADVLDEWWNFAFRDQNMTKE